MHISPFVLNKGQVSSMGLKINAPIRYKTTWRPIGAVCRNHYKKGDPVSVFGRAR